MSKEPASHPFPDFSVLLREGVNLEAAIYEAGARIREQSKADFPAEFTDTRLLLFTALSRLATCKSGVPGASSPSISHRLILNATFVQGLAMTETLVMEGQYAKAAAALKQDYELLVRVREVLAGTDKHGVTPQVRHAPDGSQRYYGDLNKLAHPSCLDVLTSVIASYEEGEARGVSPIPTYVRETAYSLYELHLYLMFEMTREAFRLFEEMYGSDQPAVVDALHCFAGAIELLKKTGTLREPAPSSK